MHTRIRQKLVSKVITKYVLTEIVGKIHDRSTGD